MSYGNDQRATSTPLTPQRALQSVLAALAEGRISDAVDRFDDQFAFSDHGLDLTVVDKDLLTQFFQKSRELFPDTSVEAMAVFEEGDLAVAEWKLRATNIIPFGAARLRDPVSLSGVSVVQIRNGRITRWSDYYDGAKSRRVELAAFFKEWVE